MNLVRFNPWSIVDLMQRDFDRCTPRGLARASDSDSARRWAPAVDIVEEKERFVLRANLPGVERDDINVTMEDGVLTIEGERRAESRDEIDGVRRFERATGRFLRRFSLPETADAEGITASSANGILEVVIRKLPEVKPRRINVEAA